MEDGSDRVVFTGDTLFIGGIVRSLVFRLGKINGSIKVAGGSSRVHQPRCTQR